MVDTIARNRFNPAVQKAAWLTAYVAALVVLTQALLSVVIMIRQTGQEGNFRPLNREIYGDPLPWYYLINREWALGWFVTWGTATWCAIWATLIFCAAYHGVRRNKVGYCPSRTFMGVLIASAALAALGLINYFGRGLIY